MRLTDKQKAVFILRNTEGIGTMKANRILESVEEPSLIATDPSSISQELVWHLGYKGYEKLLETAKTFDFASLEQRLTNSGAGIVTLCDEEYPFLLKQFEDKPLLLYYKGDVSLLSTLCIAVVGTRYPTKYGVRVTEDFVDVLCSEFTIVSGLATGVDSIAHRETLRAKGKTIAVLGNGIDKVYPPENLQLYKEIAENGLIITEYDFGTMPQNYNFPARNRIITGLSRGVLVTEAGVKSGTMITINHALSQGREVFVVPGSIYNPTSAGCNTIIKECQAIAVTSVEDILGGLGMMSRKESKPSEMKLDVTEEAIIGLLEKGDELHFEEILARVDLTVPQLNSLLVKMSARGIVKNCKNNYWSI